MRTPNEIYPTDDALLSCVVCGEFSCEGEFTMRANNRRYFCGVHLRCVRLLEDKHMEIPTGKELEAHKDTQTALAKAERDKVQSEEPIMKFFAYEHLPAFLQAVSAPFKQAADHVMTIPRCAERTVALRKLLEAKDAAVRAALP